MMVARHRRGVAPHELGDLAAWLKRHSLGPEDARLGLVAAVANDVRQVLMQGAAEHHVENLEAAADAENRQPGFHGRASQFHLSRVAPGAEPSGLRMLWHPVQRGVKVAAARQYQAIELADRL